MYARKGDSLLGRSKRVAIKISVRGRPFASSTNNSSNRVRSRRVESRMMGNYHVRFLEEKVAERLPTYSISPLSSSSATDVAPGRAT